MSEEEIKSRLDDLEVKLAIHSRIHSVYDDHVPTHQILESMALRLDNIEDRLAQVEQRLAALENRDIPARGYEQPQVPRH